jgi:carbon monoxide dehydrogenase subunit G
VGAGLKANLEARSTQDGASATDLQVVADVQFSGALAGLGQPLIRKKADSMVQEFAENLRRAIAAG